LRHRKQFVSASDYSRIDSDGGLDVEQNPNSGGPGSDQPGIASSGDYEYDEAHDVSADDIRGGATEHHRVESAPEMNRDRGGDYGYDEAHDFGAS
jgi:hypothetical protein